MKLGIQFFGINFHLETVSNAFEISISDTKDLDVAYIESADK